MNHEASTSGVSGHGRAIVLAMALAAAWGPTGCREQSESEQADAQAATRQAARKYQGLIAFVGASERDPLWPLLKASARRYDREMCSLEVRYLCPRNESPQEQIDLINGLANENLRGLCIQLGNPPALERTLRTLYDRGVQIVSLIKPAPAEIRAAHVGFDETEVGTALADAVAHAVGDEGTIMLLHAGTKDPIYFQRLTAFENEMAQHRRVEILAEIDCRMDPFEARKTIRERTVRFPRLSAWVSLDDWPLRSTGLSEPPLPRGCRLVTFGGYPDQWPLIREGALPIVVAANYREMGMQALVACEVAARNVSRFKPIYNAPLRTVHERNLDAFIADWKSWLHIDQEPPTKDIPGTSPKLPAGVSVSPS